MNFDSRRALTRLALTALPLFAAPTVGKPAPTAGIEETDEYRRGLDLLEGRIGAGRLQLGEGLIEIDLQNRKGALARCGDARLMVEQTEAAARAWQALPSEQKGHRKIEYIVRFNRIMPDLKKLKAEVERCLEDAGPPPAPPRAPPGPADATS